MESWFTKQEMLDWVELQSDEAKFCPECLSVLRLVDDMYYYCPNESCLNQDRYDLDGRVLPGGHERLWGEKGDR